MICRNCNNEVEDNGAFCPYCGYKFAGINAEIQKIVNDDKYAEIFVDSDEQYIASLGDYYLNSYLTSKKIKRCISILSNRRIYLYGTMFDSNNDSITRYRTEKVVNVDDITGTGFVYTEAELGKLISGAFLTVIGIVSPGILSVLTEYSFRAQFFMLAIVGIILLVASLLSRKSLFFIEYAGGSVKFDASIYGIAESQDFHKQIRRVQDYLKSQNK